MNGFQYGGLGALLARWAQQAQQQQQPRGQFGLLDDMGRYRQPTPMPQMSWGGPSQPRMSLWDMPLRTQPMPYRPPQQFQPVQQPMPQQQPSFGQNPYQQQVPMYNFAQPQRPTPMPSPQVSFPQQQGSPWGASFGSVMNQPAQAYGGGFGGFGGGMGNFRF